MSIAGTQKKTDRRAAGNERGGGNVRVEARQDHAGAANQQDFGRVGGDALGSR
jgi:hypothetical protein